MSADKKETLGLLLLLLTFAISAATYVIREGLAEGKKSHYEPLTLTLTLTPTPTPTPTLTLTPTPPQARRATTSCCSRRCSSSPR